MQMGGGIRACGITLEVSMEDFEAFLLEDLEEW
jgi:hypothetical protein